jgi:hypothetical protein
VSAGDDEFADELLEAALRLFLCFDDFIAPCIKLGVFLLQLRMGKDVILFGILSRYHLHFTNE